MVSTHGFTDIDYRYHQQNHNQGISKQDLPSKSSILFSNEKCSAHTRKAMPTQVGIFYWICGAAQNFGNNREPVLWGKETSCTFIGYKQDNCMEQRSQDFQESARRWELTDRELYGIYLNLGEDDLTTAGDLLYLELDNKGKNFKSIVLADQILA